MKSSAAVVATTAGTINSKVDGEMREDAIALGRLRLKRVSGFGVRGNYLIALFYFKFYFFPNCGIPAVKLY